MVAGTSKAVGRVARRHREARKAFTLLEMWLQAGGAMKGSEGFRSIVELENYIIHDNYLLVQISYYSRGRMGKGNFCNKIYIIYQN